jgi:hypothetical protein
MLNEASIEPTPLEVKRPNSGLAVHTNFIVEPGAFRVMGCPRGQRSMSKRKRAWSQAGVFQLTRGPGDPVRLAEIEERDREQLAAWKLARMTPGTPEWEARIEMRGK